jgi:hypothetical protein
MKAGKLKRWVALALCACTFSCMPVQTGKLPVDEYGRLQDKIAAVIANGDKAPVPPKTTIFSESEVNTILNNHMRDRIPNGISEPQVRLLGNSRVTARVVVDVDEFKRKRRSNAGPVNFFSGKMPVLVRGDLITREGQGQFKLQSAEVNGIPLPKSFAQELLATYTRTRDNPNGIDIERPSELPANIRQLIINLSEVLVVQ